MTSSLDDWIHCAKCGAMNPPDRADCSECGAPLDEQPPSRRDDEPRRRNPRTQKLIVLAKARKRLRGVRGILLAGVVGSALGGFVSVVAEDRIGAGLDGLMGTVCILGAAFIYRAPVVWTVVTAAIYTALTAWTWTQVEVGFDAVGIIMALRTLVSALLWLAVPSVRQAQELLADDDRAEDLLSGRHRTDAAPSEARDRVQSRRYREKEASNRIALYVILAFVGAGVIAVVAQLAKARVAPIDDEPARFGAALAAGDLDAAKAFATEEQQSRWPKVVKILERESWASGVEVGPPSTYRSGEEFHEIHYDLPRGKLKTMWVVESGDWRARRVVFSKVRAKGD